MNVQIKKSVLILVAVVLAWYVGGFYGIPFYAPSRTAEQALENFNKGEFIEANRFIDESMAQAKGLHVRIPLEMRIFAGETRIHAIRQCFEEIRQNLSHPNALFIERRMDLAMELANISQGNQKWFAGTIPWSEYVDMRKVVRETLIKELKEGNRNVSLLDKYSLWISEEERARLILGM
jgi:hypothetical protein